MSGYSKRLSKTGEYYYFLIWGLYLVLLCEAEVVPVLTKQCDGGDSELRASECTVYGQYEFNGTVSGHLLKRVEVRVLPAIQCHVDKSIHSWYCGTYSHLHLGAPAVVGQDELISTEECRIMSEQRVLNIDGRQLPVAFYERSMVYFINGSVLYEDMAMHGVDPQCS